jgi:hypothetical protein
MILHNNETRVVGWSLPSFVTRREPCAIGTDCPRVTPEPDQIYIVAVAGHSKLLKLCPNDGYGVDGLVNTTA